MLLYTSTDVCHQAGAEWGRHWEWGEREGTSAAGERGAPAHHPVCQGQEQHTLRNYSQDTEAHTDTEAGGHSSAGS